jgi:ribose transport system ATP-binding protein
MTDAIVEFRGISKYFAGIRALENVDFACASGSIHAVLGENGAGKSTLIKIMSAVLQPDAGEMRLGGEPTGFTAPQAARDAGIISIFQELSLIPDLTVADNISISDPPRRLGLIDRKAQILRAEELLARVRCEDVDPNAVIRELSLSRRQMVEIAKALGQDPKVLILDEATSALTSRDVQTVYDLLAELRSSGVASLFISHRMHEVDMLCDTLSVFRNGHHIETFAKGEKSEREIIRLMIGRDFAAQFPPKPPPRPAQDRSEPMLSVRNLAWGNRLNGIDLSVDRGEIVGLGGLDGQGQKELLLALFGVLLDVEGEIKIGDDRGVPKSPAAAKSAGTPMALVPEDRKTEGLMLGMPIADNLLASSYARVSRGPFIDPQRAREAIENGIAKLQIKVGSTADAVMTLSGGNQQKVVIAKWLLIDPDVILLNDPTRGIDVGTKQEIYKLMRELANEGKAILFYSSDYAELIGCCDRVSVLYGGRVVSEQAGNEITEESLVTASLNIESQVA